MGHFKERIAQALTKAGFDGAARKLTNNGWLIEARVPGGRSEQVKIDGKVFDLETNESLARLSETLLQIQRSRPVPKPKLTRPKLIPGLKKAMPISVPHRSPEEVRLERIASAVSGIITERLGPYQGNLWFPLTAPYRLWVKASGDKKALAELVRHRLSSPAVATADNLLREAGFGDTFDANLERLAQLERMDVISDLWAALSARTANRWKASLELLASVGACPLPSREQALLRGLPGLIGRLLAVELEQSQAQTVLKTLFGTRRDARDYNVLKSVHEAVKIDQGEQAAELVGQLLECWTELPRWASTSPAPAADVWASLQKQVGRDPRVPDEVMRSLLEAALKQARDRQVYALPEVEYWVRVPDRTLSDWASTDLGTPSGTRTR